MQRVHIDEIEIDDFERYFWNGTPFTGEVIETSPTGSVVERSSVTDGWEDGPQEAWYPNGQIKFQGTTRMMTPVGMTRDWHENGTLAREREFDDRGRVLSLRRWTESGELVDEKHWPEGF